MKRKLNHYNQNYKQAKRVKRSNYIVLSLWIILFKNTWDSVYSKLDRERSNLAKYTISSYQNMTNIKEHLSRSYQALILYLQGHHLFESISFGINEDLIQRANNKLAKTERESLKGDIESYAASTNIDFIVDIINKNQDQNMYDKKIVKEFNYRNFKYDKESKVILDPNNIYEWEIKSNAKNKDITISENEKKAEEKYKNVRATNKLGKETNVIIIEQFNKKNEGISENINKNSTNITSHLNVMNQEHDFACNKSNIQRANNKIEHNNLPSKHKNIDLKDNEYANIHYNKRVNFNQNPKFQVAAHNIELEVIDQQTNQETSQQIGNCTVKAKEIVSLDEQKLSEKIKNLDIESNTMPEGKDLQNTLNEIIKLQEVSSSINPLAIQFNQKPVSNSYAKEYITNKEDAISNEIDAIAMELELLEFEKNLIIIYVENQKMDRDLELQLDLEENNELIAEKYAISNKIDAIAIELELLEFEKNLIILDSAHGKLAANFKNQFIQYFQEEYKEVLMIEEVVERQKYNNYGHEIIENFIKYLVKDRLTQDKNRYYHSQLSEQSLLSLSLKKFLDRDDYIMTTFLSVSYNILMLCQTYTLNKQSTPVHLLPLMEDVYQSKALNLQIINQASSDNTGNIINIEFNFITCLNDYVGNYFKKIFLPDEFYDMQKLANKHNIDIKIVDEPTLKQAYKKIALKTHPDKYPDATEDFIKAKQLLEQKESRLPTELYTSIMQKLQKVNLIVQAVDTAIDSVRVFKDPSLENVLKVGTGCIYLTSMYIGKIGVMIPVAVAEAAYQVYQGDYWEAAISMTKTIGYTLVFSTAYVTDPATAVATSTGFTCYATYSMLNNGYELYNDLLEPSPTNNTNSNQDNFLF